MNTVQHTAARKLRALTLSLLLAAGLASCASGPTPQQQAARERLAKAEAMFEERCKRAGVKVYRTAENVEGVFLMKVRPDGIVNYGENEPQQFALDDPYGSDVGGDGYILEFLRITRGLDLPCFCYKNT